MLDFSVVIPAFRAEATIAAAIASALGQVHAPREVIVVDDGSPDATARIARESFPRVTVVRQENHGTGAARNAGLRAASTRWVAFLDADDLWLPNHLLELDGLAARFPGARLLSTGHAEFIPGQPLRFGTRGGSTRRPKSNYFRQAARDIGCVWTSAAAVARDTALELGGFGPWTGPEDLEFWARVALHHPVAMSSVPTAIYRRGTGGVMESTSTRRRGSQEPGSRVFGDLGEISPSSETVMKAIRSGDHAVRRRDLERYVDSRVTNAWIGLLKGERRAASRHLVRLLHHPLHPAALRYRAVSWIPAGVSRAVAAPLLGARARLRRT